MRPVPEERRHDAMSMNEPGNQAAWAAGRVAQGGSYFWWRRTACLAVALAGTVLLTAACGGSPGPAASPSRLYHQSLSYSRCMRSHGVPDFPILRQRPGGTLIHPVSPPPGMLTAPGYDAAFRACLKLAVVGGGSAERYQTSALKGLKQSECMRAHGISGYPSPGALDGGLHEPDFTAIGLDPHTPRFQAAGRACGLALQWQTAWWWPAGLTHP
jgi:hypothetical protein